MQMPYCGRPWQSNALLCWVYISKASVPLLCSHAITGGGKEQHSVPNFVHQPLPVLLPLRLLGKLLNCKATEQRSSSAIDFQWSKGSRGKDHSSERICMPRMMKEASVLTQGPRRGGNTGQKFLDSQWPRRPRLSFFMGAWDIRRPMFRFVGAWPWSVVLLAWGSFKGPFPGSLLNILFQG